MKNNIENLFFYYQGVEKVIFHRLLKIPGCTARNIVRNAACYS